MGIARRLGLPSPDDCAGVAGLVVALVGVTVGVLGLLGDWTTSAYAVLTLGLLVGWTSVLYCIAWGST